MTHYKKQIFLISTICSLATCLSAHADDASSAYFGVGFETVSYAERLDLLGQELKTDSLVTNFIQRSGSYVAVDENRGFYINTSSSLLANDDKEEWRYGSIGPVQQNQITAERQSLDLLGSYRFTPHHGVLAGMRYQKLAFNRYSFTTADGTATFESTVATLDINPKYVVSETATAFSMGVGYEYDDFFVDSRSGLKWNAQLLASIPFYTTLANSSVPNLSFTNSFSGYDIGAHIAMGWPLGKHVIIAASLEANYAKRDEVKEEASTLPKNTLLTFQPAVTTHWSF